MKIARRKFLHLAAGAAALPAASRTAWAQTYPTRPVHIIVGFAAGGPTDIAARLIGQWLTARLGQQFLIENRPGANNNIATEAVMRSPADGYTLILSGSFNAINTSLYDRLNFDFLREIMPVGGIISAPLVMIVNPSLPARTVPEFIAYGKANPDKINMASAGIGNITHVAGELFQTMTAIRIINVSYRGAALAEADILGGRVQVFFEGIAGSIGHITAGRLRPLAVTGKTRSQVLPDIPALNEFLPGYEANSWYGVGAPRNTPAEIIDKLNAAINAGLRTRG